MTRSIWLSVCAGLILIHAALAQDLFHVAGIVLNAQSGTPLPHAEVYFYKSGTAQPRSPIFPGNDGRFSFDVPSGTYILRAGSRVLIQNYGMRSPESPVGSAVIVGPGLDTGNLMFQWFPPAAISGRVVDEAGEPVEGALVQLLLSRVVGGRRRTATFRWSHSDDRGEYRFGPIPGGGQYYLAVTGTPWYEVNSARAGATENGEHPAAFIPVYYPNTHDAAGAAPILVKPGEEAHADFTLTPSVGATVTITHTGSNDLKGSLGLTREGVAGTDAFQAEQTLVSFSMPTPNPTPMPTGVPQRVTQRVVGVPPGHYTAKIAGSSANAVYSGTVPVEVNGSDVTVDVPLRPAAMVTGNVRFETPQGRPAGAMRAVLIAEATGATTSALIRPDGSFAFPPMQDGQFRIAAGGPPGLYVAHSEVTDADFRDGLMTISAGEAVTVSLTFSDETGGLNGFVMNGDAPAIAVLAVLAPFAETRDPAKYRGYQTESDGSFDYRNVPAGRYYLFAVEDPSLEYANPEAVRPYLADAKVVTVPAHGSATERVSVTPARAQ